MNHTTKYSLTLLLLLMIYSVSAAAENSKAWLGINVVELNVYPLLSQHLGIQTNQALVVRNIAINSGAEKSGLIKGDILLKVDGQQLEHVNDLREHTAKKKPGSSVELELIQNGTRKNLKIQLTAPPSNITWKYQTSPSLLHPDAFKQPSSQSMRKHFGKDLMKRQSIYRSQIQTDKGVEISSVVIQGDPKDGESDIEIEISGNKYQAKVKDIDKLPEIARDAAKKAIEQGPQLQFGGLLPPDASPDELFNRQMEHFEELEKLFFSPGILENKPQNKKQNESPIKILPQNTGLKT